MFLESFIIINKIIATFINILIIVIKIIIVTIDIIIVITFIVNFIDAIIIIVDFVINKLINAVSLLPFIHVNVDKLVFILPTIFFLFVLIRYNLAINSVFSITIKKYYLKFFDPNRFFIFQYYLISFYNSCNLPTS